MVVSVVSKNKIINEREKTKSAPNTKKASKSNTEKLLTSFSVHDLHGAKLFYIRQKCARFLI
jgi:hypothetical protein